MRYKTGVFRTAGEPDNVLELVFDDDIDDEQPVRLHTWANFRDGEVQAFVEYTHTGWCVCVNGSVLWCATLKEAWSCLPARIGQADEYAPLELDDV